MKLVVDHVRGTRRGQRQVFPMDRRIVFGRHPDNDVAFDAKRDIDASTRHAELLADPEGRFVLRDLGSSNQTWIESQAISEFVIPSGEPVLVEFGAGGPILQIWIGEEGLLAPAPPRGARGWRRFLPWVGA